MNENNTVPFLKFNNSIEANMTKGLLESNGITCLLVGETEPYLSLLKTQNYFLKLYIHENDIKKAEEILSEHKQS